MVTSVAPNLQARLLHALPGVNGALKAEGIRVVPIRMAWGKNHRRQKCREANSDSVEAGSGSKS